MKIALLSFEYPPDTGFGGIGTYTWYQARALVKLGHDVHVLAGTSGAAGTQVTEHDGVVVHRHRSRGLAKWSLNSLARMRMWWSRNRLETAVDMARNLGSLRRIHRFDVIEMPECGAEGMLINHFTRTPTVVRFHSPAELIMPYYKVRRADTRLTSLAERVAIRGASALSSCSAFLAREVAGHMNVREPIEVISNGIDLELFDATAPSAFRAAHGIPEGRPMIFFAGRMERRKGIHLCREIASQILARHDVSFVMAGQDLFDIMAKEVLPYVNAHTLRGTLHYVGKLDLAAVRSGVMQSDIFLLPSLWENCPYSCLEAMAAGRAIVSTDQGGMPELIRDGENGVLARNGDASDYVRKIEALLADDAARSRYGRAARHEVEQRLTDVQVAKESVALYQGVAR